MIKEVSKDAFTSLAILYIFVGALINESNWQLLGLKIEGVAYAFDYHLAAQSFPYFTAACLYLVFWKSCSKKPLVFILPVMALFDLVSFVFLFGTGLRQPFLPELIDLVILLPSPEKLYHAIVWGGVDLAGIFIFSLFRFTGVFIAWSLFTSLSGKSYFWKPLKDDGRKPQ